MSNIETMVWAIELRRPGEDGKVVPGFYPNPTAKFVAAALARRAWATGRVGWSQTSLARDTGLSPRTIWTALRDLEAAGLIKREPTYVDNLRKADRLIFTLRAVTITLEPLEEGDQDLPDASDFANIATAAPGSQNLRGEPVAKSARGKPTPSKPSEAKASSGRAKTRKKSTRAKMHLVPEDWKPKPAHVEKIQAFGWPDGMFEDQVERFREHEFAVGKTDFDRAFHRWLRTHNDRLKGRADDRFNNPSRVPGPSGGMPSPGDRLDAMRAGAMGALNRLGGQG